MTWSSETAQSSVCRHTTSSTPSCAAPRSSRRANSWLGVCLWQYLRQVHGSQELTCAILSREWFRVHGYDEVKWELLSFLTVAVSHHPYAVPQVSLSTLLRIPRLSTYTMIPSLISDTTSSHVRLTQCTCYCCRWRVSSEGRDASTAPMSSYAASVLIFRNDVSGQYQHGSSREEPTKYCPDLPRYNITHSSHPTINTPFSISESRYWTRMDP